MTGITPRSIWKVGRPFFAGLGAPGLATQVVANKFAALAVQVNAESAVPFTPEQIAHGFLQVANENMCRPIRNATKARGFATYDHNLVSFGGAGGRRFL